MTVTCCGPIKIHFAAAKRLAHHLHLARPSRFVVFWLKGSARAVGKGAHRHSSNFRAVLGSPSPSSVDKAMVFSKDMEGLDTSPNLVETATPTERHNVVA